MEKNLRKANEILECLAEMIRERNGEAQDEVLVSFFIYELRSVANELEDLMREAHDDGHEREKP